MKLLYVFCLLVVSKEPQCVEKEMSLFGATHSECEAFAESLAGNVKAAAAADGLKSDAVWACKPIEGTSKI